MLSKKIGIDLGTAAVTVYVKGEGIVFREPSVVATDDAGTRVVAVGAAASELAGRAPAPKVVRAVSRGAVVDYRGAGAMLQHILLRVCGRQRIFRPDVMLAVPSTVGGVERRLVLEATMQAGAKTAYLIEKPLAAAIGAGIAIGSTDGIAICDLGAGSIEAAVIAHGEMVTSTALPVGGDRLDEAIVERVRQRHDVIITRGDAERLKIELGQAGAPAGAGSAPVPGRDASGGEAEVRVDAEDVRAAIAPVLEEIAQGLQAMLDGLPPALLGPVRRNGLVLTGGSAQLQGLDRFLAQRLNLPTRAARNPQACVATGTGLALENLQLIRRGQHYIT
ncbi:MAG TPA: rod shape-determining protein [Candidatus Limnocylindrales bacterium]|nr:rod shape-determining protein [Candidatus Limnocylindrales bacterium]